jgi:ApaG protein
MSSQTSKLSVPQRLTTHDVTVLVRRVRYLPNKSNPDDNLWTWAYEIEVINGRKRRVTLLRRWWEYEYGGQRQEPTINDFVDGRHPEVEPAADGGRSFSYVSGVPLPCDSASMGGHFLFETDNGVRLPADVPRFRLHVDPRLDDGPHPQTLSPDPKDASLLNKAIAEYVNLVRAGARATLKTRGIGLSARARWDVEQFLFKSAFSGFNQEKRGILSIFDLRQSVEYLRTLDTVDIPYDDRYICGPTPDTGVVFLRNVLIRKLEDAARTEVLDNAKSREMARRTAAIYKAVALGGDLDVLLPSPAIVTPNASGERAAVRDAAREATPRQPGAPRPRWESREGDDLKLTPEEFVDMYYAAEKAAVTPRPVWEKNGSYANKPAEFVAFAYAPEMKAGTLHRGVIAQDNPDLAVKLASWLRHNDMPEDIDIPTKPEWNTRQLDHFKKSGQPVRTARRRTGLSRLYDAKRQRDLKLA